MLCNAKVCCSSRIARTTFSSTSQLCFFSSFRKGKKPSTAGVETPSSSKSSKHGDVEKHRHHPHPHRDHLQGIRHAELPVKVPGHDATDRKFAELVFGDIELQNKVKGVHAVLDLGSARGPIVILWGWAGSRVRQLFRYGTLHRDLNDSTTLKLTAPILDIIFLQYNLAPLSCQCIEITERLLNHAAAARGQAPSGVPKGQSRMGQWPNPVFIHLFSNGGGFLYEKMSRFLFQKQNHSKYQLFRKAYVGTIFDSSPAIMDWEFRKQMWRVRAFREVGWWGPYAQQFMWFSSGWLVGYLYVRYLIRDPISVPQLYLFSDIDILANAIPLEKYLIERRKHNARVDALKFIGSPHVNHLAAYPAEYSAAVKKFMEHCAVTP